ncbi:MAG: FxsA family protein [Hyphomicrobiaceae bacterium]|nr:MAG: FxsA family protein [Hyphomicrobiaceae bacterium]
MARLGIGLVLIALPLVEIAVLIKAGQLIGFWATLAVVVATGALGIMVLAQQRFAMLSGMLKAVNEGQPPVAPVIDGAFLVLAGGLLFSPGLIADTIGLLLLIGPVRRFVARWSITAIATRSGLEAGRFRGDDGMSGRNRSPGAGSGPIIEGEFKRLDEKTTGPGQNKGVTRK